MMGQDEKPKDVTVDLQPYEYISAELKRRTQERDYAQRECDALAVVVGSAEARIETDGKELAIQRALIVDLATGLWEAKDMLKGFSFGKRLATRIDALLAKAREIV